MNITDKLFSALKSAVGQSSRERSRTASRFHSARRMQMEPLERRELLSVDGFVGTIYSPSPEAGEGFGNYVEAIGNDLVISTTAGTNPMAYRINPATGDVGATYTPPETGSNYDIAVLGDNVLMRGATIPNQAGSTDELIYLFDGDSGNVLQTFVLPDNYNGGSLPGTMAEYHTTDADGNALNLLLFPEPMTPIDDGNGNNTAAGVVYAFDMASGGEPLATIENPTPAPGELFGFGIAVQDSTIYITTDGAETTYDDYGNPQCEVMYAFDASNPDPALWECVHTFVKEEPANGFSEYIGNSLMLYGDRLYVGDSSNDLNGSESGIVHVFETYTTSTADELDGEPLGTWDNPTPQSSDFFGFSLATLNGNILVGSPQDQTTGIKSGAVYVYSPDGDLRDVYLDPTPGEYDMFGRDIAIAGDFVAFSDGGDDTNGNNAGAVQLFNTDSTVIYVSDAMGLVISEDGATTDTFNVVLSAEPTAEVTLNLSISDPTEATLSTATLTFSPYATDENAWNIPQTVTVTGIDDDLADNDQTFTVDFAPAVSADLDYNGYQPASLPVLSIDDEMVVQTYSNTTTTPIPDVKGNEVGYLISELQVDDVGTIDDLNLQLFITHPRLLGLYVYLESPNGTIAHVINGDLGSLGLETSNLPGTILDDEAETIIDLSSRPFDGTYQPQEPLSMFDGEQLQGMWKLHVIDANRKEVGTLDEWSLLNVRYQPPMPNDAPVAADDGYSVDEDGVLTVDAASGVLANDMDSDGGPDAMIAQLDTGPDHGSLTLGADGSITYTPDADFNGADSFAYVASDGQDDSNVATVTITVEAVNDAPVAVDDSASTTPDTAVTIDLLANDIDPDGDTISVVVFDPASDQGGAIIDSGDGTVTYTPAVGVAGTDTFAYTISDGALTATATVTIDVQEASASETFASTDTPLVIADAHPVKGPKTTLSELTATPADPSTLITTLDLMIALDDGSTDVGDLSATLTSPNGVVVSVTLTSGTTTAAYTFASDQTLDGVWTLAITDSVKGGSHLLNAWSLTAPSELEGMAGATTEATDAALAALFDLNSTDEEDADPLATQAADELAMMMME